MLAWSPCTRACRTLDDEARTGSLPADLSDKIAAIVTAHEAGLETLKAYIS